MWFGWLSGEAILHLIIYRFGSGRIIRKKRIKLQVRKGLGAEAPRMIVLCMQTRSAHFGK